MMQNLQDTLPGFSNIKRYWDKHRKIVVAKILPGEFYISRNNEVISTVLGSCISACIWDDRNRIGGMNHFMLPLKRDDHGSIGWQDNIDYTCRYGNWAMEYLVNEILKNGGNRRYLKAKIFGGGQIIKGISGDVGAGNISFVLEYLKNENIELVSGDYGGNTPRKVVFHPLTGKAQMKRLQSLHNDTIQQRESQYMHDIENQESSSGDVELF